MSIEPGFENESPEDLSQIETHGIYFDPNPDTAPRDPIPQEPEVGEPEEEVPVDPVDPVDDETVQDLIETPSTQDRDPFGTGGTDGDGTGGTGTDPNKVPNGGFDDTGEGGGGGGGDDSSVVTTVWSTDNDDENVAVARRWDRDGTLRYEDRDDPNSVLYGLKDYQSAEHPYYPKIWSLAIRGPNRLVYSLHYTEKAHALTLDYNLENPRYWTFAAPALRAPYNQLQPTSRTPRGVYHAPTNSYWISALYYDWSWLRVDAADEQTYDWRADWNGPNGENNHGTSELKEDDGNCVLVGDWIYRGLQYGNQIDRYNVVTGEHEHSSSPVLMGGARAYGYYNHPHFNIGGRRRLVGYSEKRGGLLFYTYTQDWSGWGLKDPSGFPIPPDQRPIGVWLELWRPEDMTWQPPGQTSIYTFRTDGSDMRQKYPDLAHDAVQRWLLIDNDSGTFAADGTQINDYLSYLPGSITLEGDKVLFMSWLDLPPWAANQRPITGYGTEFDPYVADFEPFCVWSFDLETGEFEQLFKTRYRHVYYYDENNTLHDVERQQNSGISGLHAMSTSAQTSDRVARWEATNSTVKRDSSWSSDGDGSSGRVESTTTQQPAEEPGYTTPGIQP